MRIDNSEVIIENDKIEEEKDQRLSSLHLEQHRVYLDQEQEIKQVKKRANTYTRQKDVIKPNMNNSCSALVRRTRSYNYERQNKEENQKQKPLQRSHTWSYVSISRVNGSSPKEEMDNEVFFPSIPFASQPIRMKHIPSVSDHPELALATKLYTGPSNTGANFIRRQRQRILSQDGNKVSHSRSYKTLKEMSDINKISKENREEMRLKVLQTKKKVLAGYNEILRGKLAMFHKDMDNFKVENDAKPFSLETLKSPPIIY